MEVEIRKTKITTKILNQTMTVSESDLKSFTVLGWCFTGNNKFIVFYRSSTSELRKLLYFQKIERYEEHGVFYVKIVFGGNYVTKLHCFDNELDAIELENNLLSAKKAALWQFFL